VGSLDKLDKFFEEFDKLELDGDEDAYEGQSSSEISYDGNVDLEEGLQKFVDEVATAFRTIGTAMEQLNEIVALHNLAIAQLCAALIPVED